MVVSYSDLKHQSIKGFKTSKRINDMRFYLLTCLALESGARVSDLLQVQWYQIDFNSNIFTFDNQKSKKKQRQNISDELVNMLKIYKQSMYELNMFSDYVFWNDYKNSLMSRITANRRTKNEFNINFHELRKLAGKNIAKQKGVVIASKYLGHSRVSTTDLYLGISEDNYLNEMKDVSI